MEYEARIETANEVFISENRPGYLTDRGRIYVLFGPPMDRITSSAMESDTNQEIWYYGSFPVVFIDEFNIGTYKLITYNLTSLRDFNLTYMHELDKAQTEAQKTIRGDGSFFNFDLEVKTTLVKLDYIEILIVIELPMTNLWFKAWDKQMVTVLDLHLTIRDEQDALIWEHRDTPEIRINEEDIDKDMEKTHRIEIPVSLKKHVDKLRHGKFKLFAELTDKTGERRLLKVKHFQIKTAGSEHYELYDPSRDLGQDADLPNGCPNWKDIQIETSVWPKWKAK